MKQPTKTIKKLESGTKTTIVAIGDSLTQGWMVSKGYVDFLEEMLNKKYTAGKVSIINRGIPGDTAQGGLHRLEYDVITHNPDLTLIQFALNDMFMGCPVEKYANHVQTMIEKLQNTTDSEILLVTSVSLENDNERRLAKKFYDTLKELSLQKNTLLAEVDAFWDQMIAAGTNRNTLVQDDGVHPTVTGYKLMAEAIWGVF